VNPIARAAIMCGALVLLCGCGGRSASCPASAASNAPATAAPAAPAPTAAPAGARTLLDQSGSGDANTREFNAPNHWRLNYSAECEDSNQAFYALVFDGTGKLVDDGVSHHGGSGHGTSDVYHAGALHLEISTSCTWHVQATTI